MSIRVLPFLFLPSFSLFPSLLPSSCNGLHAYSSIDSPRKKWRLLAVTVRLYARLISKEFAYAQIDSCWFEITQRYIVLEAAISVSCFYSIGQTCSCTLWISRYVASITFYRLPNGLCRAAKFGIHTYLKLRWLDMISLVYRL